MIEQINIEKEFKEIKDILDKLRETYPIMKFKEVENFIKQKAREHCSKNPNKPERFLGKGRSYIDNLQLYFDVLKVNNPSELLIDDIDIRNKHIARFVRHLSNLAEQKFNKEAEFVSNTDGKIIRYYSRDSERKIPSKRSLFNAIIGDIRAFYTSRGKPISQKFRTYKSGANTNRVHVNKDLALAIFQKLHSPEYRLLFKLNALTGLRIDDLITTLTSGKYSITKFKEKDFYYIANFETMKEKVEISILPLHVEIIELLKVLYPHTTPEKLDLRELFKTRNGNTINYNNYNARLKEIILELNITQSISSHQIRKYFTSQLDIISNDKLNSDIKEYLTGHTIGLKSIYGIVSSLESMYKLYKEIIEPAIALETIIVDKTNKEIVELNKKLENATEREKILTKQVVESENLLKGLILTLKEQAIDLDMSKKEFNEYIDDLKKKGSKL